MGRLWEGSWRRSLKKDAEAQRRRLLTLKRCCLGPIRTVERGPGGGGVGIIICEVGEGRLVEERDTLPASAMRSKLAGLRIGAMVGLVVVV